MPDRSITTQPIDAIPAGAQVSKAEAAAAFAPLLAAHHPFFDH